MYIFRKAFVLMGITMLCSISHLNAAHGASGDIPQAKATKKSIKPRSALEHAQLLGEELDKKFFLANYSASYGDSPHDLHSLANSISLIHCMESLINLLATGTYIPKTNPSPENKDRKVEYGLRDTPATVEEKTQIMTLVRKIAIISSAVPSLNSLVIKKFKESTDSKVSNKQKKHSSALFFGYGLMKEKIKPQEGTSTKSKPSKIREKSLEIYAPLHGLDKSKASQYLNDYFNTFKKKQKSGDGSVQLCDVTLDKFLNPGLILKRLNAQKKLAFAHRARAKEFSYLKEKIGSSVVKAFLEKKTSEQVFALLGNLLSTEVKNLKHNPALQEKLQTQNASVVNAATSSSPPSAPPPPAPPPPAPPVLSGLSGGPATRSSTPHPKPLISGSVTTTENSVGKGIVKANEEQLADARGKLRKAGNNVSTTQSFVQENASPLNMLLSNLMASRRSKVSTEDSGTAADDDDWD